MKDYFNAQHVQSTRWRVFRLRCPVCRQIGTFEPLRDEVKDAILMVAPGSVVGMRRCPATDCHALVFFAFDTGTEKLAATFPPERLDFDPKNIPSPIVAAMEEAITGHANQCYMSAAIMVRKTLEELCAAQGAAGGNLFQRIQSLSTKVILPPPLLAAAQDLRLLGNDAAHLESQTYNQVGPDEVAVGIELAKELLKACYQLDDLLARMRALKRPTP